MDSRAFLNNGYFKKKWSQLSPVCRIMARTCDEDKHGFILKAQKTNGETNNLLRTRDIRNFFALMSSEDPNYLSYIAYGMSTSSR